MKTNRLGPIHRIRHAAPPRPSRRLAWPLRLFVLALLLTCVALLVVIRLLAEKILAAQGA